MEQPGGYGKSFHKTFHDPCKVRAAVFDDGKKRIALVGLDALITPRQLSLDARAEIQKLCGIGADVSSSAPRIRIPRVRSGWCSRTNSTTHRTS